MPLLARLKKISLFLVVGFVALVVAIFVLIVVLFDVNAQKQKNYITAHYTFNMPSAIHYQSRSWDSGDIDRQASWTYSYTTSSDRKTTYNSLIDALRKSGYEITQGSCPSDTQLLAYNKTAGIYLTINLNPIDYTTAAGAKKVDSITAEVEEMHGNLYADPAALSCATTQ